MKILHATGQVGDVVSISGENLFRISNVYFSGDVSGVFETVSNTTLRVNVPNHVQAGYMTVISNERNVTGYTENKFFPKPILVDFTPSTGISGESVFITGESLFSVTGVTINNINSDVVPLSNRGLSVTVPSGYTYGSIKAYSEFPSGISGELSDSTIEKFMPDIKVTGFSLVSGCSGNPIGIMGNYFYEDLMSGFSDTNNKFELKVYSKLLTGTGIVQGSNIQRYDMSFSGDGNFHRTPATKIYRNQKYYFDQADESNLGYQFRIGTMPDGPWGDINSGWYSGEFTTGVSFYGSPGSGLSALTVFDVPNGAPDRLYYYNHNHAGVGGTGYFDVLDPTGFLVTFEPSGATGWFYKESNSLLTGEVPGFAVSGHVSVAKSETVDGNWYTYSKEKFLVPCCPLEYLEISNDSSEYKWKPTGTSGNYILGGAPVTGRANDSHGGGTKYAVRAKCINKLIDLVVTGSAGISYADVNANQSAFYGNRDPYNDPDDVFTIPSTTIENEYQDMQYGGEILFDPVDIDIISGTKDIILKGSDGTEVRAYKAMEIALPPEVNAEDPDFITDTLIKDDSIFSIRGKNLLYSQFIGSGDVLSAAFHASPVDYCLKVNFELVTGNRIDDETWQLDFRALPVDSNILTGIKRGENKMVLLLNNGIETIEISGNFRYLHKPEISGFLPKSCEWGESVLISGAEFVGITGVQIGQTKINNFVVTNETGLNITVPVETITDHISIYGSGGGASTVEELGKYGKEELSFNICTERHGSCEKTGIAKDEFDEYYSTVHTLDSSARWFGGYGNSVEPYNVEEKSGYYNLRFSARQGRPHKTLYSGDSTGLLHVTGTEILDGRGGSWMWAVVKNAYNYETGDTTYPFGEHASWNNTNERKFRFGTITGDVLASGHANGFGYLSGSADLVDFRDTTYNPAKTWEQIWGASGTSSKYLPYRVYLSGVNSGDSLSFWVRGHSASPEDYQKTQLDLITGVTGVDLRLSEKFVYENYLAQETTIERGPVCPLPPQYTEDYKGVEWKNENVPNLVYISCMNWSHCYSGDHYDHLRSNIGVLTVNEPDIEILDFEPKSVHYGDLISISGKSLHNVTDIVFTGLADEHIYLSRSYAISGTSDFTGVATASNHSATTSIQLLVPDGVQNSKSITLLQLSGINVVQSSTSAQSLDILDTGIMSMGVMSGEYGQVVGISGNHLENVDFYFEGYSIDERHNYIRSLNTQLVGGTGAYVTVPREIVRGNIYVSGDNLFLPSSQRFIPIPTITGTNKSTYAAGDYFCVTGINAIDIWPFVGITGESVKNDGLGTFEFLLIPKYTSSFQQSQAFASEPLERQRVDYGYISADRRGISGNYPIGTQTGFLKFEGNIRGSFLGSGNPFLLSISHKMYNRSSGIAVYRRVLRDNHTISLGPSIEISGSKPRISGYYPNQGGTNTPITISGSNFLFATGVKFEDAAAGKQCVVNNFISGIRFADAYGDQLYENAVQMIDVYPCDWGSSTGDISVIDYNHH